MSDKEVLIEVMEYGFSKPKPEVDPKKAVLLKARKLAEQAEQNQPQFLSEVTVPK